MAKVKARVLVGFSDDRQFHVEAECLSRSDTLIFAPRSTAPHRTDRGKRGRARALQSRTAHRIGRRHFARTGRILGRARKDLAYAKHARAVRRDDSGCTVNSGKARRVCTRRVGKSLCLREPRRQCNGAHLRHWRGDHTSLQNRFFAGTAKRGRAARHLWRVRRYKSQPITSIEETTAARETNIPLAEHWSTRSMTINDVRYLLGRIRRFKRGRT